MDRLCIELAQAIKWGSIDERKELILEVEQILGYTIEAKGSIHEKTKVKVKAKKKSK